MGIAASCAPSITATRLTLAAIALSTAAFCPVTDGIGPGVNGNALSSIAIVATFIASLLSIAGIAVNAAAIVPVTAAFLLSTCGFMWG